jgi:hypothetical protein
MEARRSPMQTVQMHRLARVAQDQIPGAAGTSARVILKDELHCELNHAIVAAE